jgi:hypothetical protein
VLNRIRRAYSWSKIISLYFNNNYHEFLKEIDNFEKISNLSFYQRVVIANARLLNGDNTESLQEFFNLISEINYHEHPYLNLYCKASIADLEGKTEEYNQFVMKAYKYKSLRFDRTLPLRIWSTST